MSAKRGKAAKRKNAKRGRTGRGPTSLGKEFLKCRAEKGTGLSAKVKRRQRVFLFFR